MQQGGTDWVAVGGIAQLLAAGATVILAGVTAYMAKRTHEEASATKLLVAETQRDRQLFWQPQIELVAFDHVPSSESYTLVARNSGAAPALQVTLVARESNATNWVCTQRGDLRPGDHTPNQPYSASHGGPYNAPFEGVRGMKEPEYAAVALFCRDVLGRRFRFPFALWGAPGGSTRLRSLPPDIADGEPWPEWAQTPLLWDFSHSSGAEPP